MKSLKTVKYYCLMYKERIFPTGGLGYRERGLLLNNTFSVIPWRVNFYILNMKPEFEGDFPFISIPEIKYSRH